MNQYLTIMEQNPITPTDSLVSNQDQLRQQDNAADENVSSTDITPTNIKTSHLSKEFKDILNLLDKRNRKEGTCMLLRKCIDKLKHISLVQCFFLVVISLDIPYIFI